MKLPEFFKIVNDVYRDIIVDYLPEIREGKIFEVVLCGYTKSDFLLIFALIARAHANGFTFSCVEDSQQADCMIFYRSFAKKNKANEKYLKKLGESFLLERPYKKRKYFIRYEEY